MTKKQQIHSIGKSCGCIAKKVFKKAKLAGAVLEIDTCPNRRLLCFYMGNQNILGLTFSQLTTLSWEFKSNPIDSCLPCRPASLKGFHGRWVIQRGSPDPVSDHRQQHSRGTLATSHTVFLMAPDTLKGGWWRSVKGGVGGWKRGHYFQGCALYWILYSVESSALTLKLKTNAHTETLNIIA